MQCRRTGYSRFRQERKAGTEDRARNEDDGQRNAPRNVNVIFGSVPERDGISNPARLVSQISTDLRMASIPESCCETSNETDVI